MIEGLLALAAVLAAAGFWAAQGKLAYADWTRSLPIRPRGLVRLLDDPQPLLDTTALGARLMGVISASLLASWFARQIPGDVVWTVAALGLALLLAVSQLRAEARARARPQTVSGLALGVLWVSHLALRPLLELLSRAALALLVLLGVHARRPVLAGRPRRTAPREEKPGSAAPERIAQQVLDFAGTTLSQVMVPRTDVVGMEVGTPVREAVARIRQHRYSRLPVYREDLDHIVGLVHQFDLFRAREADQPVDELMRPVLFVPESKKCEALLREMQQGGQGMAVVLDEFGGTAGIVTVEDLLEELVGELKEEEAERVSIRRVAPHAFLVDGSVKVDDVNEQLGIGIPEGDYETVAGYVLDRLGRIPRRGEALLGVDFRIEVLAADRRRLRTLRIERVPGGTGPGEE